MTCLPSRSWTKTSFEPWPRRLVSWRAQTGRFARQVILACSVTLASSEAVVTFMVPNLIKWNFFLAGGQRLLLFRFRRSVINKKKTRCLGFREISASFYLRAIARVGHWGLLHGTKKISSCRSHFALTVFNHF